MTLTHSELLRKTCVYRVITLVYTILFTYAVFWWDEGGMPNKNRLIRSIIIGFIGWAIGTVVYYIFEWLWNGKSDEDKGNGTPVM